jgi:hypothetical protein
MMPHPSDATTSGNRDNAEENLRICSVEEIQEIYSDLTALGFPGMRMIRSRTRTDVSAV